MCACDLSSGEAGVGKAPRVTSHPTQSNQEVPDPNRDYLKIYNGSQGIHKVEPWPPHACENLFLSPAGNV